MITVTSVEAQARLDELIDSVQRESVHITRDGRTAAFLVSPRDMDELQAIRDRRTRAVEAFKAYSAMADAALTPAARELTDEDVVRLVKEQR